MAESERDGDKKKYTIDLPGVEGFRTGRPRSETILEKTPDLVFRPRFLFDDAEDELGPTQTSST